MMQPARRRTTRLRYEIVVLSSERRWHANHWHFGTTEGTAPEPLEGKRGDARTDIYALGSMIYEMLTGRLPFEGSDEEIESAKVKPVPPRTHGEVSPGLEAITMRAVARRPQDRYATAGDLLRDPESLQDAAALRIRREGPSERAPTQGVSRPSRACALAPPPEGTRE